MRSRTGLAEVFAAGEEPDPVVVAAAIARLDDAAPAPETMVAEIATLAESLADVVGEAPDPAELMTAVFGRLGFRGNTDRYYDPGNSYLHRVLATRRGIPISLAVVAAGIGRYLGVELQVVGMPGHVLIGHGLVPPGQFGQGLIGRGINARNGSWFDPMSGGRRLDQAGARELYGRLVPGALFAAHFLDPIGASDVALRMLNNLRNIHLQTGRLDRLTEVLVAQLEVPGAPGGLRVELARLLAARGHAVEAIEQFERLVVDDPSAAGSYGTMIGQLRARFN